MSLLMDRRKRETLKQEAMFPTRMRPPRRVERFSNFFRGLPLFTCVEE